MTLWDEIRTVLVIFVMLLAPGWALLSIGQYWKRWEPLQRWFLALSLGIAVYPVLFYVARVVIPVLHIGQNKLLVFIGVCSTIVIFRYRKDWKDQFKLGRNSGWVLFILAVTMATRLILAHQYPYPAWTDSVHHSINTKLVMINGQLPYTMMPYDPSDLSVYHLGLYALTGSTGLLAEIAPHSALLWFCQVINGFAAIGVFLVLDKMVNRTAGIAGMVFAGLLSFQPAWYFNWGRDTQLVGQTLLLPAALVFWELVESLVNRSIEKMSKKVPGMLISMMLLVGVAMIHFRVAAFLLPLVILFAGIGIFKKGLTSSIRVKNAVVIFLTGLLCFLLVLPAFLPAIQNYSSIETISEINSGLPQQPKKFTEDPYFMFKWKTFYSLGLPRNLTLLALIGLIFGLLNSKTRSFALLISFWLIILVIEGYLYLLNIPKFAFINMTGIMIMAYLPGALLFGFFVNNMSDLSIRIFGLSTENIIVTILLLLAVAFAPDRVKGVEAYRQFMSTEDETAMIWMKSHLPKDAVIGINSTYWTITSFTGTDAGYWIPYYAELETSTRTMIYDRSPDYSHVRKRTQTIINFYSNVELLPSLCEQGVNYLYTAKKTPYNQIDFDFDTIFSTGEARVVYDKEGVQIIGICE